MVKIRLLRIGRNKMPYYRIVAVDSKAKSNGAYIELLGQYDPLNNKIALKEDKIKK
ncbi:30S ribosomal protein S16 [bacterium]|nr:30S ribosomal protein S16 [bacterium]MBR2652159.1 30S ribosomal protein S16 [bacterium]